MPAFKADLFDVGAKPEFAAQIAAGEQCKDFGAEPCPDQIEKGGDARAEFITKQASHFPSKKAVNQNPGKHARS